MRRDSKYIVVDDGLCDAVIIFPNHYNHGDIAQRFFGKVLSAGFVTSDLRCYGKSTSLGLESRPEVDTKLLVKQLGDDE